MGTDWAYQLEKMYHSLLNKNTASAPEEIPGLSKHVSEGYAEIDLNGESCRLCYRRDAQTDLYTFIQDEDDEAGKHAPTCELA